MNQIYLVIEDNGESYEDYHEWPVAAFDDENKAKEYAYSENKAYISLQEVAELEQKLFEEEIEKALEIFDGDYYSDKYKEAHAKIYNELEAKYPNSFASDYTKHSFKVSSSIPFNPS